MGSVGEHCEMKKRLLISFLIGSCFLLPLSVPANEKSCVQILEECKNEARYELGKYFEFCEREMCKEEDLAYGKDVRECMGECQDALLGEHKKDLRICDGIYETCKRMEKGGGCWEGTAQMIMKGGTSKEGKKQEGYTITHEKYNSTYNAHIVVQFYISKKGDARITARSASGSYKRKRFLKFDFQGRCRKGEPIRTTIQRKENEVEEGELTGEIKDIVASVSQIDGRSIFLFETDPPMMIFQSRSSKEEEKHSFCTGETEHYPPVTTSGNWASTLPFAIEDERSYEANGFVGDKTVTFESHANLLVIEDRDYPITTTYKWAVWRVKCKEK